MAEKFEITTTQDGIVLSKFTKDATPEYNIDGKKIAAQPKRFFVKVGTGAKFSQDTGYEQINVTEYKLDETVYNQTKYGTPVTATILFNNFGAKALSLALKR